MPSTSGDGEQGNPITTSRKANPDKTGMVTRVADAQHPDDLASPVIFGR
jgi:hypothetical protein